MFTSRLTTAILLALASAESWAQEWRSRRESHKMLVLKDFADKESLVQKYGLVEYPKYYLPKGVRLFDL
jgi:hypothetical protein